MDAATAGSSGGAGDLWRLTWPELRRRHASRAGGDPKRGRRRGRGGAYLSPTLPNERGQRFNPLPPSRRASLRLASHALRHDYGVKAKTFAAVHGII